MDTMTWLTQLKGKRARHVESEGSPLYSWTPGAIAAAARATIVIETQFPAAKKYLPLNWLEVSNNDVVDCTLFINGNQQIGVPAGTIRPLRRKAIWQVEIRNDDAAVAATTGKILVSLAREPRTADNAAQEAVT